MEPIQEITYPVLPLLLQRQSRRAFADEAVPADTVASLLEAARWAPSCSNNQPWRFIVIDDPAMLAQVHDGLNTGNAWAKCAPLLLAVAANPQDDAVIAERFYYLFDCGLAVENLLLQATEFGLVTHPMAGFKEGVVKAALGVPDEVRIITLIALGFPGRLEELDEVTQQKERTPRTRKPIAEIAHHNRWGAPMP